MKSKSIVLLAFAGICGLVAMLGVKKALSKKEPEVPTVSVLVAMADLSSNTQLDETNTEFKAVAADSVPEDAITDRAQYTDRSLKVRALPGDWITLSKLNDVGVNGMAGNIPPGMRVVSVPVNQTTSHSGMLAPGNRVDVMMTYTERTDEGSFQRTRTVLQFIEIFAVDKQIDGAKANINEQTTRNVSVLATPKQAQTLLLAGRQGDIHLALRSNADTEETDQIALGIEELYGGSRTAEFGQEDRRTLLEEFNGVDPEDGESQSSVDSVLQDAMNGSATVVEYEAEDENVWEMKIYAGGEAKTMEVVDSTPEPAAVAPAADNAAEGKTGAFWKGVIGSYFRGM